MRVDGLVEEVEVPEDVRRADRRAERRRSYRITQAGRAVAAGEVRRLASLLAKAPAQKLLSIEPPGVP